LHLGSDGGGRTAVPLLSPVQSCKDLGNHPLAYLRDVLKRVSAHPQVGSTTCYRTAGYYRGGGRAAEKDR
jgi:hypothetical protein